MCQSYFSRLTPSDLIIPADSGRFLDIGINLCIYTSCTHHPTFTGYLPTSTLSWYKLLHNIDSACVKRHVFDNREAGGGESTEVCH